MELAEKALEAFYLFVPDRETTVWAAAWGAIVFWAAGSLAAECRRRGIRVGDTRKIFHFCVFTNAALARALFADGIGAVAVYGLAIFLGIVVAVFRGAGDPLFEALGRPSDEPKRELHVIVPLMATALGGLIANLIGGGAAIVAMLVGGWGDAVGEPVGIRWGKHRYKVPSIGGVPSTRSWEGTAAVLLASWMAAALGFFLLGLGPGAMLGLGIAVAVVATVTETVSPHGLDNFTVMVVVAAFANYLLA